MNHTEKATAIIHSVKRDMIVSEKFERDNIKPCIHLSVGELLFSEEASKKEENDKSNCKVVVDNEKTHLSISFDGETHGLIFVNRAKKANHLLRRVAHSTAFMSPELYMRSLTLFLADLNFCVNKKKKNNNNFPSSLV